MKLFRRGVTGRGGIVPQSSGGQPQLTSLVDVMTFLLIFLIQSFSVEKVIHTQAKDLELPGSTAQKSAPSVPVVEVSRTAIYGDGAVLATIGAVNKSDSLLIPELYRHLEDLRGRVGGGGKEILIQTDKEVEFSIVKRVMYTCSRAGFIDYTILVIRTS